MRSNTELEYLIIKNLYNVCESITGYKATDLFSEGRLEEMARFIPSRNVSMMIANKAALKIRQKVCKERNEALEEVAASKERKEVQSDYYVMRLNDAKNGFIFVADVNDNAIQFETLEDAETFADLICKQFYLSNKQVMVVTLHG